MQGSSNNIRYDLGSLLQPLKILKQLLNDYKKCPILKTTVDKLVYDYNLHWKWNLE